MDLTSVPVILLFIISIVCTVVYSNYQAYYVKNHVKKSSGIFLLNAGVNFFCILFLLVMSGFTLKMSAYSMWFGLIFGGVIFLNCVLIILSEKLGPFGYATVIYYLSTAFTALSGAIFWQESLSALKIVGIVLMLLCFFFAVDLKQKGEGKFSVKWFIVCILAMFACVFIGIMQKTHQSSEFRLESTQFMLVAFSVSFVLSLTLWLLIYRKELRDDGQNKMLVNKKSVFNYLSAIIVCGLGTGGGFLFNLYLSGVIDSAIFFPLVNGVPLMTNLIVSVFIFREKLSKKQVVGIIFGVTSIILLLL